MSNKFVGVAYWGGSLPEFWEEKVFETLRPVEGLALSAAKPGIRIGYEGSSITLIDTGAGMTQGVVPDSPVAGVLVVCLVALRRALGGLTVVDDAQADIPTMVRQSYPLYAGDWRRISQVAESLGLVAGGQFMARHAPVLNRLF